MGKHVKPRAKARKKGGIRELVSFLAQLLAVILLALLIRRYVFVFTFVSGGSMLETLQDRQIVAVNKLCYLTARPQRGEIVVCRYPGDSRNFVKRVVAVEGDTISVRDSVTYLNGQALDEEFVTYAAVSDFGPVTVGRDEAFVMGDNRANSHDSRSEGPLPVSMIRGRVFAVVYPFREMHLTAAPEQQQQEAD